MAYRSALLALIVLTGCAADARTDLAIDVTNGLGEQHYELQ
jgi:hypothetical protein